MPKFPRSPAVETLSRIPALWRLVPKETLLFRVSFQGGAYPAPWSAFRFYGPTTARFGHHAPPAQVQSRGILYAASQPTTSLAEVFQASRAIDIFTGEPWLVGFRLAREVRLLDLTGRWPTRAGASMVMSSGPRPRAREWSRTIYAAYPEAEGLWYPSSMHANAPAVALSERAETAVPPTPEFHRALADLTLQVVLENAALELGYAVVTRPMRQS